jgi:hypothetical protein
VLQSVQPQAGTPSWQVGDGLVLQFAEPVAGVDASRIVLKSAAGDSIAVSASVAGAAVTLTPAMAPAKNQSYTVELLDGAVVDAAGNASAAATSAALVAQGEPALVSQSALGGTLAGDALDVRSAVAFEFDSAVQLASGTMRIVDDGAGWGVGRIDGATYSEATANTLELSVAGGVVTAATLGGVALEPTAVALQVSADGQWVSVDLQQHAGRDIDFDFGSRYHVEFTAGLFTGTANGMAAAAVSDPSQLAFQTVTPGATTAGTASSELAWNGLDYQLQAGATFFSAHQGNMDAKASLNLSATESVVVVAGMPSLTTGVPTSTLSGAGGSIRMSGFGNDDTLYFDNFGNQTAAPEKGSSDSWANDGTSGALRFVDTDPSDSGQLEVVFVGIGNVAWLGDQGFIDAWRATHPNNPIVWG